MQPSSAPRLRVLAGPSSSDLTDISELVNSGQPHVVRSHRFYGRIVVHVKGFPGAPESEYFDRQDRQGVTWSIQMQGRFLQECSSDDILFGNTFDRPLNLPWGAGAALKFMHFIDPSLEHDLAGPRPWALSPLITTMPHFMHTQLSSKDTRAPEFPPPPPKSIKDDTRQLCALITQQRDQHNTGRTRRRPSLGGRSVSEENLQLEKASKRRNYFSNRKNRRQVIFGPEDILTTDFCYGFLAFPQLALNLPGGISFDLKKYWDGQPVRFVCIERRRDPSDESISSELDSEDERTFWCVVIVADDTDSQRERSG